MSLQRNTERGGGLFVEYIGEYDEDVLADVVATSPVRGVLTPRRSLTEFDRLVEGDGDRRREEERFGDRDFLDDDDVKGGVDDDERGDLERSRDSANLRVARSRRTWTSLADTTDLGNSNKPIILPTSSCWRRRSLLASYSIFDSDLCEDFERDGEG